ncbi:MAG: hypothetical protein M0R73_05770 [Dehalococcoidia bacterium]|nr:hypothetical protein [Dehalococcoidia bacterium]
MSVSPTVLLVTLSLGIPLMLLALGVLYHAYLFGRQPIDLLEGHVDALATVSSEDLLTALQEAVGDMQAQLTAQRETLAGMLSDRTPAFAGVGGIEVDERPLAAGEYLAHAHAHAHGVDVGVPTGLRAQIAALAEAGMSDRAIARELHIGLEEVRIARMRGRQ